MGKDARTDEPARNGLLDLPSTLRAAAEIVGELRTNPLLVRLVAAFSAIPTDDRAVLLEAIEHEVQARRLSLATQDISGQSMHPTPNARLYLRAHETDLSRLPIDQDDMMLAMLRGMRVSCLLLQGNLRDIWLAATRAAIGHIDSATRATVALLLRDVLGLIENPAVPNAAE